MADGTPPNSDGRSLLDNPRGNGTGGLLPPEEGNPGTHHLGDAEADAGRGRPQQGVGPRQVPRARFGSVDEAAALGSHGA